MMAGLFQALLGRQEALGMACTKERNVTLVNGQKFSPGNHPVEMGLPMLRLLAAGFKIDIVTPTGAPASIDD